MYQSLMQANIVFGLCTSPVLQSPPTLRMIKKSNWKFFQLKSVFLFHSLSPFPCFYFSVHFWPIPIFRIDSYRLPALPSDLLTPWLATPIIAPFLLGGLLHWHLCAWLLWALGPAPCSTMPLCQSQTAVGPSGTCHSDTPNLQVISALLLPMSELC